MKPENILELKPVTLVEVKEFLTKRKKEKELTYEQDLTLKYAKKFAKLSDTKAKKLLEELLKIEAVDEEFAVKLVDILPIEKEILELLVPKNITLEENDLEKILELTKKYAPKK